MAKKRLNKNLVAFLTVMGILSTVAVVFVAISYGARKDPEVYAAKAREREQLGDYQMALQLLDRAYRASVGPGGVGKDVRYRVEQAALAFRFGDISNVFPLLELAHSESPGNTEVLNAYLTYIWDLWQPYGPGALPNRMRQSVLEYARKLRAGDPDSVLGAISEAVALWSLVSDDADNQARGDEAYEQAHELDPHDRRVVLTRIERLEHDLRTQLRANPNATLEERQAWLDQSLNEAAEEMQAALAAHPGDWRLVSSYADLLVRQDKLDAAQEVMSKSLEVNPDSPELNLMSANFLLQQTLHKRATLAPADYTDMLGRAAEAGRRAVALEPALYDAYTVLAQIELVRDLAGTDSNATRSPERFEAALTIYADAISRTVDVRSLAAVLGEFKRELLHVRAFNTATEYWRTGGAGGQQAGTKLMRQFLGDAEVRYRDRPLTYFMRGVMCLAENKFGEAIQAFERADETGRADLDRFPILWIQAFNALPQEHLARLYAQLQQPGEALNYADQALAEYHKPVLRAARGDRPPPFSLARTRAELLVRVARHQEALDWMADMERIYADDLTDAARQEFAGLRATALNALDRPAEAAASIAGDAAGNLIMQAKLAALNDDLATAEARVRAALEREDLQAAHAVEGLRLLLPLLMDAGRQDHARELLAGFQTRFGSVPGAERFIGEMNVIIASRDPADRDARMLEMIAQDPDPQNKARRLFDFHYSRRQYDQAAPYMQELLQSAPDDLEILRRQFALAVGQRNFDLARELVVRLANANGDGAGGALLRGELAGAQGDWNAAVREYRLARQRLHTTSRLLVELSRALVMTGRLDEAIDTLEEAVRINPNDFEANKLLYGANQQLPLERQPADGGVEYLRKAAALNPNDPFIRERKELLDEEADPQAGIVKREARRAENPTDVANLVRLAQLYAKVGERSGDQAEGQAARAEAYNKAAGCFAEALKAEPGNALSAQAAAGFYAKTDQRVAGETHLSAFLETLSGLPRAMAHELLASFYERLGDPAGAEGAYQRARQLVESTEQDPDLRRRALARIGLDLAAFYARTPGRQEQLIETCRWLMDKLDPRDEGEAALLARTRIHIVRALLQLERLSEAEEELTVCLRDYPDDPNGAIVEAQVWLALRQWDKAQRALTRLLQQYPDHIWSLTQRGRLYMRYGRYAEALEDLIRARTLAESAHEREPGGTETTLLMQVLSDLASLYQIQDNYDQAELQLLAVMDLATPDGRNGLAQAQVAERLIKLYERARQPDKSQETISTFMSRFPNDPYWPMQFGFLRVQQGQELAREAAQARRDGRTVDGERLDSRAVTEFEIAAASFERGEKMTLTAAPVQAARCFAFYLDALALSKRPELAIRKYEERTAQADPARLPPVLHAAMIRPYKMTEQLDRARQQLELGLRTGSQVDTQTLNAVLRLAADLLEPAAVLETTQRITDETEAASPAGRRLRLVLAVQYINHNRANDAAPLLEQLLQMELDPRERLVVQLIHVQALTASGNVAVAIEKLEQLAEQNPKDAGVLNNLAYTLAEQEQRLAEALQYAETARDIAGPDPTIIDTLGFVYMKNGLLDQAEAAFREALCIDPASLAAQLHLADLLVARGKRHEAIGVYQRCREQAQRASNQEYIDKCEAALTEI